MSDEYDDAADSYSDEIMGLQAELAAKDARIKWLEAGIEMSRATAKELELAFDQNRADAYRYRWLRQVGVHIEGDGLPVRDANGVSVTVHWFRSDMELDVYIDATLKKRAK